MHGGERQLRPDIQGLRALAVLAVLAFHLWPSALPGGYAGVDVFFVISGYLITGVLLGDAVAHGRVRVGRFYARRIKRLLPAATCVLLAVAACTPLLPETRRAETALELAASALYMENYWLAHRARDYLNADDALSVVQHYWSLSVEEQYYIVWPLLLWLAAWLVPRGRARPRATFGVLIALLFAGSLAHSVWLTAQRANDAYFVTTTRAWELSLGGALAVIAESGVVFGARQRWLGGLGLAAIAAACALFSTRTPFPGYAALLPTVGAFAVIAAGLRDARWAGDALLRNRPMVYIGGISYSLYLWHWPVQTLLEGSLRRDMLGGERGLVLVISFALAHATKRWVEDPCRTASFASARPSQPFVLAAGCVALTLVAASAIYGTTGGSLLASTPGARGAVALDEPGYDYRSERIDAFVPRPAAARDDRPSAYEEDCYQAIGGTAVKVCAYGAEDAKLTLALIGDSHAAHWFPAFQELAKRRSLRFYGVSKNACAFSTETIYNEDLGRTYDECLRWSKGVATWLREHRPDVVLIAQSPALSADGGNAFEQAARVGAGMAAAWREVAAPHSRMIALGTTPWLPMANMPRDCVPSARDWRLECVLDERAVLHRSGVEVAAELTHTPLIELHDAFCVAGRCPPIIGGVLVYRDFHHVTATYARSLADRFERRLAALGVTLPAR